MLNDDCLSCQALQGRIALTNAPRILETPHWTVEHVHPTSIRGWLVVVLNRHCAALHQLTPEEFASLGQLLSHLCQALHTLLGTDKEYVIQFAEGEGFHHVHLHVIPRLPEWPEELKGPGVFDALGPQVERALSTEQVTPLALKIRAFLLERLSA